MNGDITAAEFFRGPGWPIVGPYLDLHTEAVTACVHKRARAELAVGKRHMLKLEMRHAVSFAETSVYEESMASVVERTAARLARAVEAGVPGAAEQLSQLHSSFNWFSTDPNIFGNGLAEKIKTVWRPESIFFSATIPGLFWKIEKGIVIASEGREFFSGARIALCSGTRFPLLSAKVSPAQQMIHPNGSKKKGFGGIVTSPARMAETFAASDSPVLRSLRRAAGVDNGGALRLMKDMKLIVRESHVGATLPTAGDTEHFFGHWMA